MMKFLHIAKWLSQSITIHPYAVKFFSLDEILSSFISTIIKSLFSCYLFYFKFYFIWGTVVHNTCNRVLCIQYNIPTLYPWSISLFPYQYLLVLSYLLTRLHLQALKKLIIVILVTWHNDIMILLYRLPPLTTSKVYNTFD